MRGGTVEERLCRRSRRARSGKRTNGVRCLLWTGGKSSAGYGQIRDGRRVIGVHRASWEVANGPIPPGLHVCHSCDTPLCIEPRHLFLGTCLENIADMVAKGRSNHEAKAWGETHGNAKLNEKAVRVIRASSENERSLARRYGVTPRAITDVLTRRSWSHVA